MTTLFSSTESKVTPEVPVTPNVPEPEISPETDPEPDTKEALMDLQQTQFAEDVVMTQPLHPVVHSEAGETVLPVRSPLKSKGALIALLSVAALGVMGVGLMLRPNQPQNADIGVIPQSQIQGTSEPSVLQRELILLEKDIEAADPLQAKLAFPPINFELSLEEATLLQQQRPNFSR